MPDACAQCVGMAFCLVGGVVDTPNSHLAARAQATARAKQENMQLRLALDEERASHV